jgi:NAD(P)-dependent dehydrogenase (short-subunit alcohol dehydrogenase family)
VLTLLPTIPLGRIDTREDVADAVVFLGSEQASRVTGQRILVSGGHRL